MTVPDFAALAVGLTVGFYWARVVKLALKARRATGRAANFVPPEPLGRAIRVAWYPAVGLWVLVPLVTPWVGHLVPFRRAWTNVGVVVPAALVAFVALVLTMACWRRMGKSWRMGIDPAERTQLVVSGPFRVVRHPIYALSSLLMVASVAAVPSPVMFVVGALHLAFLQWEATREERHMLHTHGAAYADYMRRVPRFLPRGRPA